MKLSRLIKNVDVVKTVGNLDVSIKDLTCDSKTVTKGSLFICINGKRVDGHKYIREAEIYGAEGVVTDREVHTRLPQIIVKDTREAMSIISGNFYLNADKKMKIVGVTGTNGKTTTTNLIKTILDKSGVPCGVIGTLGTSYKDKFYEPTLTTPDPITLHKTLFDMYQAGVKVVVMEVSAHAIDLKKIHGMTFEVGVFTNLTQDHLDYFNDINTYKSAKLKFFDKRCKYAVINIDDPVGIEITKNQIGTISYGLNNPSDVFAIDVDYSEDQTSFVLNLFDEIYDVKTKLLGEFNVYNVMAAATVCSLLGVPTDKTAKYLQGVSAISGRMEKISKGAFSVYVDYAHTPDGLNKSLTTLKSVCKGRLICLFGCGGNRDKLKREIMGKISGEIADFTVITSDNPRFEEPMDIICEIEKGVLSVSKKYVIIQDRIEAIKYALSNLKENDVLLIAGKGAEKYQEILGIKHPYNDKDTVKEMLGL